MQRITSVSRFAIVAMAGGAVLLAGLPGTAVASPAPVPATSVTVLAGPAVVLARTASTPQAQRLTKVKRSTRRLGRTTMREYQAVRDDPRLPQLRSDVAREISELAREGQRRVNSRLITLQDVKRVERAKKIRARIAKEDPAEVAAMVDAAIADQEAKDAEYGLFSSLLRSNEGGALGPVVRILKDLGL
ncbi:MAG: hypothetical protein Q8Q02_00120 [Nocardioides sp.]|nr:hypothetical protein [Nocardioides sp.]